MLRIYLFNLFYLSFISSSSIVFAAESPTGAIDLVKQHNSKIEQHIKDASQKFAELVSQAPDESVKVVAHFTNSTTIDQIASIVSNRNLTVIGFRHRDGQGSGGYTLKPNETVEQALAQYRRDHALFMQREYEMVQRLSETTSTGEDPQETMALSMRLSDVQRRQFQFKARGLQIIGLELEGPAIAIDKFKKENNFINLMEISIKGVSQPSIYRQ